MAKIYYVSVNCVGHHIYKVLGAKSQEQAINEAERSFQCDESFGEFNEMLDKSYDDSAEEIKCCQTIKDGEL